MNNLRGFPNIVLALVLFTGVAIMRPISEAVFEQGK